ncbi:hypothetical protein BHM03_00054900 [Ensete ventricosum]|nr:hypothetical protein BHM03_00054900 [Ensete ventricosum]
MRTSGATRSSTLLYDTTRRRAMDSRSECRGTVKVGLHRRVFRVCASKVVNRPAWVGQSLSAARKPRRRRYTRRSPAVYPSKFS